MNTKTYDKRRCHHEADYIDRDRAGDSVGARGGRKRPAQIAGSSTLGVAVSEMKNITAGWSAKKQILGQTLYNENNDKVGTIDDIIIAPDRAVSYAIVGAGGVIGLGKHDVAIPVDQFKQEGGKFILHGATKEKIKAMPEFEYAK